MNLGHIFQEKKCVLWAGKYGNDTVFWDFLKRVCYVFGQICTGYFRRNQPYVGKSFLC